MDLIINADDLGASAEVNGAVFDLMAAGLVTSATLIANGPSVEDACALAARFPHCSFGVHLDITEFQPLSAPHDLQRILDASGAFDKDAIRRVSPDAMLADAIFKEFCGQIKRLASLGVKASHIDSHHHVHTMPWMFRILKRVQKWSGIRRVRISRNIYGNRHNLAKGILLKKAAYNFLLKHYYRTKTTHGFTDFVTFQERAPSGKLRHPSIEVMVHPGAQDYGYEAGLLWGPWRQALDFPLRLISYHELT